MPDDALEPLVDDDVESEDRCHVCGADVSPERLRAYAEELDRYCESLPAGDPKAEPATACQPLRLCNECHTDVENNRTEALLEAESGDVSQRRYRRVLFATGLITVLAWLLTALWPVLKPFAP